MPGNSPQSNNTQRGICMPWSANVALSGLSYQGVQDWSGSDVLHVSVSDLGNTGSGAVEEASATVQITVLAVNDKPVVQVPRAALSVDEGGLVKVAEESV